MIYKIIKIYNIIISQSLVNQFLARAGTRGPGTLALDPGTRDRGPGPGPRAPKMIDE